METGMLQIDPITLLLASVLVLGALAATFLVKWWDDRAQPWMLDWGIGFSVVLPGTLLLALRGRIPDVLSIGVANAAMLLGWGLVFVGVRRFDGRPISRFVALIGPSLWALLCLSPTFMSRFDLRVEAVSIISAGHAVATIATLRAGRARLPLPSRARLEALMGIGAVLMVARAASMVVWPVEVRDFTSDGVSRVAWIGLAFLVLAVLFAQFLLLMSAERAHLAERRAGEQDDLTGILNRRTFVERAERHLAAAPHRGTLLFFDVDHFKAINDTHGHALGDDVLVAFARLVETRIGPEDLFARWGGEEFVVFLADRDFVAGRRLAEEIRRAVADLAFAAGGGTIGVTVSVGLSTPALTGPDLDRLIASADAGVYAAKRAGRDRVAAVAPDGVAIIAMPA